MRDVDKLTFYLEMTPPFRHVRGHGFEYMLPEGMEDVSNIPGQSMRSPSYFVRTAYLFPDVMRRISAFGIVAEGTIIIGAKLCTFPHQTIATPTQTANITR